MSAIQKSKSNKVQVSFRLSPDLLAKLKKESDKTGLTGTRIVEKAIAAALARKV